MPHTADQNEATSFSFQVDLLKLNLHLAETETRPEPATLVHEAALAQMRQFLHQ